MTSQICMQCLTDLIFSLVAVESIIKNPQSALLYRYFRQSFESDYLAVKFLPPCGFKIFEHLIARGYDLFQKWMCLYPCWEWPYFTDHLQCLGGLNEYRLEVANWLEYFSTCAFEAILCTLPNGRDRQSWHRMYHLASSSSPSIRPWDQLNGETIACKSSHCKVKRINRDRAYWLDWFNGWWNSFGHREEARKSRNHHSKFAEENDIWHPGGSIVTEITDKMFQTSR